MPRGLHQLGFSNPRAGAAGGVAVHARPSVQTLYFFFFFLRFVSFVFSVSKFQTRRKNDFELPIHSSKSFSPSLSDTRAGCCGWRSCACALSGNTFFSSILSCSSHKCIPTFSKVNVCHFCHFLMHYLAFSLQNLSITLFPFT